MDELQTGIIGIGGHGAHYLTELGHNENFTIKAVADHNIELAKEAALQYDATPYDDYRRLIVQEKLDVLFLLLPNFSIGECVQLAARNGMHLFKETPLARTLPEAMQYVEMMEKADRHFQIGTQNRFAPGYLEAHEWLGEKRLGEIFLTRAEMFTNVARTQPTLAWRGDPVQAGGGVLIDRAYHLIDQIVWNLGAPDKLYSLNTDRCSKHVLPPSQTEDAAVLTMNFPNGSMGNVISSWMIGPEVERLCIHGTEGSLEVSANLLQRFDPDGNVIARQEYNVNTNWLISQQIRHFADTILNPDVKPINTGREHLRNVAIIESAYLSARTQLPESLRVYGSLFKI